MMHNATASRSNSPNSSSNPTFLSSPFSLYITGGCLNSIALQPDITGNCLMKFIREIDKQLLKILQKMLAGLYFNKSNTAVCDHVSYSVKNSSEVTQHTVTH